MTLKWNPPRLPNKTTATYANTADHALIVHDGAVLNGGAILPAREFMLGAFIPLGPTDPPDYAQHFADRFRATDNLSKAWRSTSEKGQSEIKKNIRSKIWPWPNVTQRTNKKTVGSPRDIIDTGDLLGGQQPVRFS